MINPSRIKFIAEFITDDPDVFCEDMAGNLSQPKPITPGAPGTEDTVDLQDKPLSTMDIEKQADQQIGSPDGSQQIADQMKLQQDMEHQRQVEHQKLMEPQLAQLRQAMQKLNTGVLQGQQAATTGGSQYKALGNEMVNINSLLGNLEKQL